MFYKYRKKRPDNCLIFGGYNRILELWYLRKWFAAVIKTDLKKHNKFYYTDDSPKIRDSDYDLLKNDI